MTGWRRILLLCVLALPWAGIGGASRAQQGAEPVRGAEVKRIAGPGATRKVALVFGNARYASKPLGNPENDAADIAAALRSGGAGKAFDEVVLVRNANRTAMYTALEDFRKAAAGAQVALIYFAGHGVQIENTNYLVPVDVPMDQRNELRYNAVRLEEMLEAIGTAQVKLVILDACRNNPFDAARGDNGGLAAVREAPRGTLIAYSTSPGRVARDGRADERNSPYAKALLKAMMRPGLAIEEVFKATRREVAEATGGDQIPWESTSLLGDFSFTGPIAAASPVALARTSFGGAGATRSADSGGRSKVQQPGARFRDCERCPEMVTVGGGGFRMGSPAEEAERQPGEGPMLAVKVPSFAIGRLEVTFDEWEACLVDGGCPHWPDHRGWGRGLRPVINVSWEDAQAYVAWLTRKVRRESGDDTITYRLPSEAEWEFVARAGTTTARWWGDAAAAGKAVCRGCGMSGNPAATALPGDQYANPFGVQHMLGNVWEWVADCRNPDLGGMSPDARARADGDCAQRGLRGGSWDTAPRGVRAATRAFYPAGRRSDNIGFRVATDVNSVR